MTPKGEASPTPHSTSVVVWDVPSTIERGEQFSVKVGVKCASGCGTDGRTIEIRDHEGKKRATATTGGEPWPDTAALCFAEVELSAPETEGLHTWEARATAWESEAPADDLAEAPADDLADDPVDAPADGPAGGLGIPHTECIAPFGVRVVPSPECLLTVVAIDMESQTPVEGAKVVVHPYKTFTDELGVAEVRLPKGEYRLFVSGKNYFPFRSDGEIETDVTIRAELTVDRELSDADIWI